MESRGDQKPLAIPVKIYDSLVLIIKGSFNVPVAMRGPPDRAAFRRGDRYSVEENPPTILLGKN